MDLTLKEIDVIDLNPRVTVYGFACQDLFLDVTTRGKKGVSRGRATDTAKLKNVERTAHSNFLAYATKDGKWLPSRADAVAYLTQQKYKVVV